MNSNASIGNKNHWHLRKTYPHHPNGCWNGTHTAPFAAKFCGIWQGISQGEYGYPGTLVTLPRVGPVISSDKLLDPHPATTSPHMSIIGPCFRPYNSYLCFNSISPKFTSWGTFLRWGSSRLILTPQTGPLPGKVWSPPSVFGVVVCEQKAHAPWQRLKRSSHSFATQY